MKRIHIFVLGIILALVVSGCSGLFETGSAEIDCEGAVFRGTNGFLIFDNTGTGRQVVSMSIRDNQGFGLFDGTLIEGPIGTSIDLGRTVEYVVEPHQNPITIRIVTKAGGSLPSDFVHFEFTGDCDNIPFFGFGDDRISPDTGTALNTFIRDEGLSVYSEFYGSVFVPYTAIDIATPSQNTLIASGNGIEVYILSDGLIQIMEPAQADGKRSILIIDLDDSHNVVRSRRGHFNIITGRTHIYLQTNGWEFYPMDF